MVFDHLSRKSPGLMLIFQLGESLKNQYFPRDLLFAHCGDLARFGNGNSEGQALNGGKFIAADTGAIICHAVFLWMAG